MGGSGGVSICRAGRRERVGSFGKFKYILGDWRKFHPSESPDKPKLSITVIFYSKL